MDLNLWPPACKVNFAKHIGVNLAIYQSGTEVLKKRDIGSKKRNFFSLLGSRHSHFLLYLTGNLPS